MSQPDTSGPGLDVSVEFLASIDASLGEMTRQMADQADRYWNLNQFIYPIEIPAQQGKVTGGGALTIASPELLGPRSGWFWDVRRISVSGLASSSEIVNIYRGSTGSAVDAVANSYLSSITGPEGAYAPGLGAAMLRANQSIVVTGSSLTASELVTVTYDAIAVHADYLGAYLL